MKSLHPKKLLIVNILDILRKYTDADHRLSQKEIVDILKNEYDMTADRKSVKRNIMCLIECGYDINYSESIRMVAGKDGTLEESYILSDFYLDREFSDSELRLLIDSLLFSKHIPYRQRNALVEKLEGLSSQYFRSRVRYIKTLRDNTFDNRQLFYTIEVLDEAIFHGRQVAFNYNHFETDKKLHPALDEKGKPKEYIINPYQIAATNGRYYLICNYDKYDNVANYRLDRITNIRILPTPAKPQRKVKGLENGLDLPKHMTESMYMFSGESIYVKFVAKKTLLNDLLDWFGKDILLSEETADEVTATVHVNEQAMRRWAMQYGLSVRVISPASLAEQVKNDLLAAAEAYK